MLADQVPLMKAARISHLADSEDSVIRALTPTPAAKQLIESQARPRRLNGTIVTSTRGLKSVLAQTLHQSVDGRGLSDAALVLQQHLWVSSRTQVLSGSIYVGAVKIRRNLMATALRKSRGRELSSGCDCCLRTESLGHILQVCPTHLALLATIRSLILWHPVHVGTGGEYGKSQLLLRPAGIHRPDLILDHQDTVIVLDVTIVADNADLYEAHQHKCDYYDQPAIRDWVSRNVSTISPTFSSVTLNWHGLLAPPSADVIRTLGLSALFLSLLSAVTLERGHYDNLLRRGPSYPLM